MFFISIHQNMFPLSKESVTVPQVWYGANEKNQLLANQVQESLKGSHKRQQ